MAKKRVVSTSKRVDQSKVGKKKKAGTDRVYRGTMDAEWTCSSCGREHISGNIKKCPSCGNPKDAGESYAVPMSPGQYLSEDELEERGVDPHLHLSDEECPYCGAKLKPGTQKCPNCGAPLTDVGYTSRVCPACGRESSEEICPNCGAKTELKPPKSEKPKATKKRKTTPKPKPTPTPKGIPEKLKKPWVIPVIVVAMLALLACCIFALFPRTETATVSGVAWTRTIGIQEYQYNERGDWSLPPDADLIRSEERVHHNDQVLIGYEEECGYEESCETISVYDYTETTCYDDGTCDEHDVYRDERECTDEYVCEDVPQYQSVPVYQTWYTYRIWEWVDIDPARASGNDADLYWPQLNLSDEQREKPDGRQEKCVVTFVNSKERTFEYNAPCSDLTKYQRGSKWEIKRTGTGIKEVNPAR